MTDMTPEKRRMMQEMIELAAKDQEKQIAWIGKLHRERQERLKAQLQKQNEIDELA